MISPDVLDKKVKHLLENATKPIPAHELCRIIDPTHYLTEQEVSIAVDRLRKQGMDIKHTINRVAGGGYYIPALVTPPKGRGAIGVPHKRDPMFVQYPLDTKTLSQLSQLVGGEDELIERALNAGPKNVSTYKRRYFNKDVKYARWTTIQRFAEMLGVPAELLVDEQRFFARVSAPGYPAIFAGYKLTFGIARKGLSIYTLVPPRWTIGREDFWDDPWKYPRICQRLSFYMKGYTNSIRRFDDLVYMCRKAEVPVAAMFSPMRKQQSPELEALVEAFQIMNDEDLMLMGAIAHLLTQPEADDDMIVVKEVTKLIRQRKNWAKVIKDAEKGKEGRTS